MLNLIKSDVDGEGPIGIIRWLGRVAQLVRAPPLQGGGRRFESCPAHLEL